MGRDSRTKRKKDRGEALHDLGIALLCFKARAPLPSLMPPAPAVFSPLWAVLPGRRC